MSSKTKRIFANLGIIVILLTSSWEIGRFVSQSAVRMDGQYFEESSFFLKGAYYNDWLPVFSAFAFGLGWIIVGAISVNPKIPLSGFPIFILSITIIPFFSRAIYTRIDKINYSTITELIQTSTILDMVGCANSWAFNHARKIEKDINDRTVTQL